MRRSVVLTMAAVVAVMPLVGCTHSMKVRNIDEFKLSAHTGRRHIVRLDTSSNGSIAEYGLMIRDGLTRHISVEKVVLSSEPLYDLKPDVQVHTAVGATYKGSGWNFPITFPGFLVFSHAWNGYVYKANLVTRIDVTDSATGKSTTRTLTTNYDLRHCDFGRGFWSSSGWWMPGWGATSLLSGFFMVTYDNDATPLFETAVSTAYGDYVANHVVEMLGEIETGTHASARCSELVPGEKIVPKACS
jgi:hypothetical protein